MLLNVVLVSGRCLRLAQRDPALFIVESTVLCKQDADEKIDGGRVVSVDGSSSIKGKDEDTSNKVEYLSVPSHMWMRI